VVMGGLTLALICVAATGLLVVMGGLTLALICVAATGLHS